MAEDCDYAVCPFGVADLVVGGAGLLTGVAARGWFIAPLLGLGGGVWASCRYWGPPCLRFIQAACLNWALY